jgi:NadR type nicotinamide-nucleotide adenylyltransferase
VCTLAREPIPGALRHAWMAELCPGARVVHVHDDEDELPQEPAEDPRFWQRWVAAIRRVVPSGPDLVFTSEDYGDELARQLGARHVCVDRARAEVPISGTRVRADPLAEWAYLPAPVRAHFVKRVVVYGAESTGKTTLAAELAAHFGTVWVPEYAREHLDRKGPPVELADMEPIARGQIAAEDRLARAANRVLFCDTDLATTAIYSEAYFGVCADWICAQAAARRYDLYLFCDIDAPWVDDRWRDFGHRRAELYARFAAALKGREAPVVPIRGPWSDRLARAIAAIDDLWRLTAPARRG